MNYRKWPILSVNSNASFCKTKWNYGSDENKLKDTVIEWKANLVTLLLDTQPNFSVAPYNMIVHDLILIA